MKILFVHHSTFSANSMNHIGPFAAELKRQGHEVAIALPELDPSFRFFPYPQVPAFSYEDILENPNRFEGEPHQIVHAWTPREIVRQFCEKLWQKVDARLIIHLEDDESAILERTQMRPGEEAHRTDPLQGPMFLEVADAITVIVENLSKFAPEGKPAHHLFPGFEAGPALKNTEPILNKSTFGIPDEFKVITYPGAASGANAEDLIDLFKAIHLLNEHGTPCLLIKTGFPDPGIRNALPKGADSWIRDIGFLPRENMWRLIELADIVVQPGRINDYNQSRLPSKLPDFLCLGKPVVTSAANLGQQLIDGEQALLLNSSTAEEIAGRCQELFSNRE
ncbi:MAG: glycosyltransferase, partial [Verrucomicrobia bacterium]|nr:glycosyltransferase [Verrucomicrobiota bacterium]